MAKTFPNEIPNWISADQRRSAEIKVFNKLKSELENDWVVFYSRPWWGITSTGGEKDGEADFIIAHPELGILFLEVKGGEIAYNVDQESWTSKDRHGIVHSIKNPMQQAIACKYQILKKLQNLSAWPSRRVIAHHGVVFVDTISPSKTIIAGFEAELFCHSIEFENNFANWIVGRLQNHVNPNEFGPGEKGISCLKELLADPISIRCTFGRNFETENQQMQQALTGIQFQTLGDISDSTRLVIEGGAGTGKTLIACEAAMRLAQESKSVLLTCQSNVLISELTRRLKPIVPNLKIESISEGIKNNASYDCIIIDEGQDVDWSYWDIYINKLRNEHSKLIVFMDSNQAIYRLASNLVNRLGAHKTLLRVNLRNTLEIAELVNNLYEGPMQETAGPSGSTPKFSNIQDIEKSMQAIVHEIKTLVDQENIKPSDIAVLSNNNNFLRKFSKFLSQNKLFFSDASTRVPGGITVDSILNFKGLESSVVFLYADNSEPINRELAYVGFSRARNYLHVYSESGNLLINNLIENKKD